VVGRAWKASREKNSIAEISTDKKTSRYQSATNEAEYEFDKVFGEDSNTNEIYNELVGEIVDSVANGVNGTVFTYGQTSSGKTFTMRGDDSKSDSSIGIIQLAAKEIFTTIQQEKSSNPNCECNVRVSYTEIYNEELRDLLNDSKRKTSTSLTIREDKRGSITVEGRKEVAVSSLEELMEVFRIGEANKSVGCTKMNDRSSRSHVIFQVTLMKKTTLDTDEDKENDNERRDGIVVSTTSTLNLVDLAGSESVRHTGAIGMQKKEGGMINQRCV
jgi:centromeric protein E